MDVDADNERHKREERERQRQRRERRANKSEDQKRKEARRREINRKTLEAQGKGKKAQPPPPTADTSKFQALFKDRTKGFVIEFNFRNAAPRPPVGPCFVGHGIDGELNDKWTKYMANNAVEANYAWQLHAEPDLGVPLAPSAMDIEGCYVDPLKEEKKEKEAYDELFDDDEIDEKKETKKGLPPLHPDDEALVNWKGSMGDTAAEEIKRRKDMAKAKYLKGITTSFTNQNQISLAKKSRGFTSRVLDEDNPFFMKKTTYLANDPTQRVHDFKSLAHTKQQAAEEIEQKLEANKLSGKEAIEKSFELASKTVNKKHPTKSNVEIVCEIPLLPDDITWGHNFTQVVLDSLPKLKQNQLESAYIADVNKGAGSLRMECNLLVTDESSEDYNPIQKYELDIVGMKEEDAPHSNFLFIVDEDNKTATYHPITSRVQLSAGRPPSSNIVPRFIKKRKLEDYEIEVMEKSMADVDADLAKKYGIEDDDKMDQFNGTENGGTATKRSNPFDAGSDSSDDSEDGF